MSELDTVQWNPAVAIGVSYGAPGGDNSAVHNDP